MISIIDSWKHDWFYSNRYGIFQREALCFFSECFEKRHFTVTIIYMKKIHQFSGFLDVLPANCISAYFDGYFDLELEKTDDYPPKV